MKRRSHFLTELLLCLILFSLCTAVCTTLFARAHQASQSSRRLTQAVTLAQNAAQCVQAVGADPDAVCKALGASAATSAQNAIALSYDQTGRLCDASGETYRLSLCFTDGTTDIQVSYGQEEIFSLSVPGLEDS